LCCGHGLRWRDLPRELGYGRGVTCWRRLRQWQALGVWAGLHRTLLKLTVTTDPQRIQEFLSSY
jgi:transposase